MKHFLDLKNISSVVNVIKLRMFTKNYDYVFEFEHLHMNVGT